MKTRQQIERGYIKQTNLINIWSLGMRTWSNCNTPLSMVLYAPFPNFIPISPTVMPGRGKWSSKLRNWTMKPKSGNIPHLFQKKKKIPKLENFNGFGSYHSHRSLCHQWLVVHKQQHVWKLYPIHQATTIHKSGGWMVRTLYNKFSHRDKKYITISLFQVPCQSIILHIADA